MKVDPDALNRWLAEEVMHYRLGSDDVWRDERGVPLVDNFNPYERWADCEPLLEQIEKDWWRGSMFFNRKQYEFSLIDDEGWTRQMTRADTRTAALCLAIARAYGWEEPHEEA